jgi:hypothetical protein
MFEKNGASKIVARMNGLLKCRKGRRPARVETFLKKGSESGADLRLPVMGGTKFPTGDSLAQSKAKLKEHQNVGQPKMVRPIMQPVAGVSTMPKISSAFADDPLVQYLKKVAQKSKVDSEGKLDDNEGDMKTGPDEKERVSTPPDSERGDKTHSEWRQVLNALFSNKSGITEKYTDKEGPGLKGHGIGE